MTAAELETLRNAVRAAKKEQMRTMEEAESAQARFEQAEATWIRLRTEMRDAAAKFIAEDDPPSTAPGKGKGPPP